MACCNKKENCGCNTCGVSSAFIVLILFILLAIIFSSFIF